MAFIKCCGHSQKAKVYRLENQSGYHNCILKQLIWQCPCCASRTIQLERSYFVYDQEGKIIDECRDIKIKTKKEADELFKKCQASIVYEEKQPKIGGKSNFYLNYSEFGKKKKCYSNLSTLKMGKFDNVVQFEGQKFKKAVNEFYGY